MSVVKITSFSRDAAAQIKKSIVDPCTPFCRHRLLNSAAFSKCSVLSGISGKADFSGEDFSEDGLISLTELYTYIGQCIDNESARFRDINMSPQISELLNSDGEFFFISDSYKKQIIYNESYSISIKNVKEKDGNEIGFGNIKVYSRLNGELSLNGKFVDSLKVDETKVLSNQPEGEYLISLICSNITLHDTLFVKKGYNSDVFFLPPPTQTYESSVINDISTGSIRLFTDNDSGRVYIDEHYLGYLNPSDDLILKSQPMGNRKLKIINSNNVVELSIDVPKDETILLKFQNNEIKVVQDAIPPAPPSGIRISNIR